MILIPNQHAESEAQIRAVQAVFNEALSDV